MIIRVNPQPGTRNAQHLTLQYFIYSPTLKATYLSVLEYWFVHLNTMSINSRKDSDMYLSL